LRGLGGCVGGFVHGVDAPCGLVVANEGVNEWVGGLAG
jgi:hypothetical protein